MQTFLKSLLAGGRTGGKEAQPASPAEEPVTKNPFEIQPDHTYRLFGSENPTDIKIACDKCNKPYDGLCQQGCVACGTGRTVFYVENDPANPQEGPTFTAEAIASAPYVFPDLKTNRDIKIGSSSIRKDPVAGKTVTIGAFSGVSIVGATESILTANNAGITTAISPKAKLEESTHIGTQVVQEIISGYDCHFQRLIITPEGTMEIGTYATIGTLIIGPTQNKLYVGSGARVERVIRTPFAGELENGTDCIIGPETVISFERYYEYMHGIVVPAYTALVK